MIGYICSAITDFVVTFADDSDIINLHGWSQGSFSGTAGVILGCCSDCGNYGNFLHFSCQSQLGHTSWEKDMHRAWE